MGAPLRRYLSGPCCCFCMTAMSLGCFVFDTGLGAHGKGRRVVRSTVRLRISGWYPTHGTEELVSLLTVLPASPDAHVLQVSACPRTWRRPCSKHPLSHIPGS